MDILKTLKDLKTKHITGVTHDDNVMVKKELLHPSILYVPLKDLKQMGIEWCKKIIKDMKLKEFRPLEYKGIDPEHNFIYGYSHHKDYDNPEVNIALDNIGLIMYMFDLTKKDLE